MCNSKKRSESMDHPFLVQLIALKLYISRYGLRALYSLTPDTLYDYILFIAEDKNNRYTLIQYGPIQDYEQETWLRWCFLTGVSIHTINHEPRASLKWLERLPSYEKLETLIKLHSYRFHFMVLLYSLLILSIHIWANPFIVASYTVCDQGNISEPCIITVNQRGYQFDSRIDYYRYLPLKEKDERALYYSQDLVAGDNYLSYRMIDGSLKWLRQSELLYYLSLHQNTTCVCPILMGIAENITFLNYRYRESDKEEWIIMYRPFIYRNNTLSNLIESTVLYQSSSSLYENYLNFVSNTAMNPRQIHYETIYVEYTELSLPVSKSDSKHEESLICRIEEVRHQQRRITLTQQDTICFHFCDTTNRYVY